MRDRERDPRPARDRGAPRRSPPRGSPASSGWTTTSVTLKRLCSAIAGRRLAHARGARRAARARHRAPAPSAPSTATLIEGELAAIDGIVRTLTARCGRRTRTAATTTRASTPCWTRGPDADLDLQRPQHRAARPAGRAGVARHDQPQHRERQHRRATRARRRILAAKPALGALSVWGMITARASSARA